MPITTMPTGESGKKNLPIKWRDNIWYPRIVVRPASRRLTTCSLQKSEPLLSQPVRKLRAPGLSRTAKSLLRPGRRDLFYGSIPNQRFISPPRPDNPS
jgi:hypothetical protein